MKKLISLLLSFIFICNVFGTGTVTFTLVTTPCDTNGVLVAHIPAGGIPPYRINWNGGNDSCGGTHFTSLLTDTLWHYSGSATWVTVYDSTWSAIDTGGFAGAPPFSFTFDPVPPVCGGMTSASVTVMGGTPPYTFEWLNTSTFAVVATSNPAMLGAGIWGIMIRDAAGCRYGTFHCWGTGDSINYVPTFSVTTATTTANCTNGTAAGIVTSGGTPYPPFTFKWSNGATDSQITGLTQGVYMDTITDSHGCYAVGYADIVQSVYINVPITPTPATCLASDGAVIAFGSGGVPPYSYLWSNGATTQGQTGIPSAYYYVTATDANGCTGNNSAWVSASTPITVTYSATPSLCTAPTGTATLTIIGGTPPYHDTFYTSPIQTGITATALAPGNYSFHIVDAVGCIRDGIVTVPPIDVMSFTFSPTPALCTLANGSLNVAVSGGVPPLSYSWTTGSTASTISSVHSGWYYVTVTDANSCAQTHCGYVPDYSPVTLGVATSPASCLYTSNGTALAVASGGTLPYNYSWNTGATTNYITGLPTGDYRAYVTDATGCFAEQYSHLDYNVYDSSCYCVITGTIYNDLNNNCVRDAGEPAINHMQVFCSGIGYTYTNDSGRYYFLVPSGSYTITETIRAFYPLASCQLNSIPVTAVAATGCVHNVDFANTINPIHSVHICTWDYTQPVPGNYYTQKCIVSNQGTVTETNILGGYKNDGQLFGATYVPSGVFTLDSTNWYTTTGGTGLSLIPGGSQSFFINYLVPTFVPLGTNLVYKDSVAYTSPMTNWLTDYTPWNNVNYHTSVTVSSFDPNFKEVNPKGVGALGKITYADSNLQYMVHFQNTGTYQAEKVVVIDTLDANLDWTSLQPVYESSPCKITLSNTGVVKYTFEHINLPPASTDPVASNGMFTYSIKTRSSLPVGTQFKNSASIYFDYNAPVKTNTTLNTLYIPSETENLTATPEFFSFYPNPANDKLNVGVHSDNQTTSQMSIADLTGRTIINKTFALQAGEHSFTIPVNQLATGIYFISMNVDGKMQTKKLVIVR